MDGRCSYINEFSRKIYELTRIFESNTRHAYIILYFFVYIKKKKVQTPFFFHRTVHGDDDAGESKKYYTH